METLVNIVVIAGVASVGLLWTFSLAGAAAAIWETIADQAQELIKRIKG